MTQDLTLVDTDVEEAERSFEVAFVGRLKHGALRRAAERLGSQTAVAQALGIHDRTFSRWINLFDYPKFSEELDTKLVLVVGRGWYELWPEELRYQLDSKSNTLCKKRAFYRDLRSMDLLQQRETNLAIEEVNQEEVEARLKQALKTLSYREREIIKLRYGLGRERPLTLEEAGKELKTTRERIRQIEAKAIRKLQQPYRFEMLKGLLSLLDGQAVEDQTPLHQTLKDKYPYKPPPPKEQSNDGNDQKP